MANYFYYIAPKQPFQPYFVNKSSPHTKKQGGNRHPAILVYLIFFCSAAAGHAKPRPCHSQPGCPQCCGAAILCIGGLHRLVIWVYGAAKGAFSTLVVVAGGRQYKLLLLQWLCCGCIGKVLAAHLAGIVLPIACIGAGGVAGLCFNQIMEG